MPLNIPTVPTLVCALSPDLDPWLIRGGDFEIAHIISMEIFGAHVEFLMDFLSASIGTFLATFRHFQACHCLKSRLKAAHARWTGLPKAETAAELQQRTLDLRNQRGEHGLIRGQIFVSVRRHPCFVWSRSIQKHLCCMIHGDFFETGDVRSGNAQTQKNTHRPMFLVSYSDWFFSDPLLCCPSLTLWEIRWNPVVDEIHHLFYQIPIS